MSLLDISTIILLVICAYTDLRWKKVLNIVIGPTIATGLLLQLVITGWPGLMEGLQGFFLGLALLLIPFAVGGIGAGDVKLLATIGLFQGTYFVLHTILAGVVCGGVMALFLLLQKKHLKDSLGKIGRHLWIAMAKQSFTEALKLPPGGQQLPVMPYTIPIAIGAAIAFYLR